jgi:hypothetical protein
MFNEPEIVAIATISAIPGGDAAMSDYATVTASTFRQESLSERTVAVARRVLAGQRCGFRAYLAFVGPAVVASIAYMDPGNFATNIQAGAKYGYTLLWVVLLANVIAMLFQALSAKLGIGRPGSSSPPQVHKFRGLPITRKLLRHSTIRWRPGLPQ